MNPSIHILQEVSPRDPILVAAWPGMGNVAYGAAMYLKEGLKPLHFASIRTEDIFFKTGVQVQDGILDIPALPGCNFFYHRVEEGKRDLIIFIGESQPVMEKELTLAHHVLELALHLNVREIITFAATPVNITHRDTPGVWCVATGGALLQSVSSLGARVMTGGHIGGLNGLLLGVGKEAGIDGLCLLGEIPFYTVKIENPRSSIAILNIFARYTNIPVDTEGLEKMARYVEEEIDRVSRKTKRSILEGETTEGEPAEGEPTEGEEAGPASPRPAIERRIPNEVSDKIEFLFRQASEDISKAGELKSELDRWGLFVEYEDRFLDLFGKGNM
jgi:proteasome assembly chaperone (PAC2) family protein